MNDATTTGLTSAWLAERLGIQPARVEALRRAGQLVGVPREQGGHVYPSWQFGRDGRPLPAVARIVAAARSAGIDDRRLHDLVTRRAGLTGDDRLVDGLRHGRDEQVLRALAQAG